MSEVEVLSRLGPPTREEITGQTSSRQTITGYVDRDGSLYGQIRGGTSNVIKKYYYLGDFDRGEKTTVITFSGGRVIGIVRISSPHW